MGAARTAITLASCGAAASLLAGCISLHSYPDTWDAPSPARPDACPDISGTYENTGQSANGAWGATMTGWLLHPPPRLERGEFECADGTLSLSLTESCCMDGMVSGRTVGTVKLSRTPGHAVLGVSDIGADMVMFVPVVFAQHNYERFTRIEQARKDGAPGL